MSDTHTCPKCGEAASGNFCASCGTSLGGRFCNQCGARAKADSTFCSECGAKFGAAVPAAARKGTGGKGASGARQKGGGAQPRKQGAQAAASTGGGVGNLGWWMAAAMMVVVMFFMIRPIIWPEPAAQSVTGAPFASGGAGAPAVTDISNMSPREAADRLYTRVMTAASANDSAQVVMFLPMTIQAYDIARPLDADGLFHLSRLQRMALQDEAALASAQEGLALNQTHLLNLYAGADAALAVGLNDLAQEYLTTLLQVWDEEMASGNQDYQLHSNMMSDVRAFAEANIAG